jgi:hypothetical protein
MFDSDGAHDAVEDAGSVVAPPRNRSIASFRRPSRVRRVASCMFKPLMRSMFGSFQWAAEVDRAPPLPHGRLETL